MILPPVSQRTQATRQRWARVPGVALLWGFLTIPLLAAGAETRADLKNLDATELVRRAVEKDEALRRAHAGLIHDEQVVTEKIDSAGKRVSSETKQRNRVVLGTQFGSTQKMRADGSGAKGSGAAGDNQRADQFAVALDLRKLAGRFELRREPDAPSEDGRPCYVVSFRPRETTPKSASREEKVMGQLAGRFWLSQEDLAIVQSQGSLTQAVTVAWVASVYELSFRYRSQLLPSDGSVIPASFVLDVGVKAPLYHSRQRQTTTLRNFQGRD